MIYTKKEARRRVDQRAGTKGMQEELMLHFTIKDLIEIMTDPIRPIKGQTLPIDSVRLSLFNEVYNKFVECENDDEFTKYLNENTNEA
jgi:hypothetical protein